MRIDWQIAILCGVFGFLIVAAVILVLIAITYLTSIILPPFPKRRPWEDDDSN